MRKRALIPTLLTLGNAVCGLAAIAYASRIGKVDSTEEMNRAFLAASGWLICGAMLFDTLDGFFARLFKAAGRFGAELDSLCDAISFGVAPAFILLQIGPGRDQALMHKLLAAVATLYMMCAILRLARFNVESVEGSKNFKGLPSPAAAGCIASLAIVRGTVVDRLPNWDPVLIENIVEGWATAGAALVALLMVSNISYPHLTKKMLRSKRRGPITLVPIALVIGIVLREYALVVMFWAYALSFFAQAIWVRVFPTDPELDGELNRRY